jgi:butyryl-CoA dehydrogenase
VGRRAAALVGLHAKGADIVDFKLNEDQQMVVDMVQDFAARELAPNARAVDEAHTFPWERVRQLAELDLMGIPFPEEYGGVGMDFVTWGEVGALLSRNCSTTGTIFGAHILCAYPIFLFGTEEQKKKFLTPLCKGEKLGAFGLTEPNAGSDAGNVQTRATLDGDEYILNGTKIFISNGGAAEIYVIIANISPEKGARGLTAFIVEKDTPGFTFGKDEEKMAYGSMANRELIFTDCRIPKENMLNKPGRGFRVAMQTLDVGRIGMGVGAVGLAQAALDAAVPYAKTRVQFAKPIASFQAIQMMLADMATEIEAAHLLCLQAAWLKDAGLPFEKQAAMAKLFASETVMRVTTKAVQVFGGYGYTKEYPVERFMREAKLFEIVEGTSEIQRQVIASHVLKEYGEEMPVK